MQTTWGSFMETRRVVRCMERQTEYNAYDKRLSVKVHTVTFLFDFSAHTAQRERALSFGAP